MGLLDRLLGNASALSVEKAREKLDHILVEGEEVDSAFVFVRDLFVFTNRRIIFLDKEGITGMKVDWVSIPYRSIARFSAVTAGPLEVEADLYIWLIGISDPIRIEMGRSVQMAEVYKALSRHVVGT